ncbi:Kynurenine formamidase [Pseudoalteromonas sp. DSM 26666]|uniref:cyclase family protein n=1 Tax=Pseudoalteromonas sp. DSM 26666 TaxID=1761892 RepID=UPI0008E0C810|nr:cyclase family protein [Pseudoalteromonas sp. DSM 26666]SFT41615.1 Kynurenine formamidase [Pseudoalteromonas sp. DSM 26666]
MKQIMLMSFMCLLISCSSLATNSKELSKSEQNEKFITLVSHAKTYDLSHVWDESSPIASVNPKYSMTLNATHADTRGTFGDNGQLSFASEIMQWSGHHGGPTIDALGHIGRDGLLYGGVNAAQATNDREGIGRSGVGAELAIDHYPVSLLSNRTVLLDVARFINGDETPLGAGFDVTASHLKMTAKSQGVKIKKGDTVFIRTGWGQYFSDNPQLYIADNAAGVGLSGTQFLIKAGASVVGNDTLTFEKRPPIATDPSFQVFPVHMMLLADNGIYIIENLFLEELAKEKVYEFIAIVPPLKIRGGTGSALRVFALTSD